MENRRRRQIGAAAGAMVLAAVVAVTAGPRPAAAAPRAFSAGEVRTVAVAGEAGVPEDGAAAVLANLTATDVTAPTFVTAWPSGADRPATSNLNPQPGQDVANLAVVPLDDSGAISVYNHAGTADVVVDVVGFVPATAGFHAASARLLDTRSAGGPLEAGGSRQVPLGVPAGAAAVVNLTGVGATVATFLTAWPAGTAAPVTSNLNLSGPAATANLAVVQPGADGAITIANHAGNVDVVVDLLGWFPAGAGIQPLAATRLLDTRTAGGAVTPDRTADIAAASLHAVTGAATSGALVATLTGVDASNRAFVTAWSGKGERPATSNLNLRANAAVANLLVLPVAAGDDAHLFLNVGRANLVVDAIAWVPDGGAITTVPAARVYDSRTADASGLLRPPTRAVTYSVAVRGTISADVTAFAASAAATYADPRGWRAAGITFTQVASGGDFTLWLSQAELVPSFGTPCTVNYSCRVGRNVIINESRWRLATPVWTGSGRTLDEYQDLVVNHETGHWLGFGHAVCGGAGQLAPVMQQQSKGLGGCLANPWPLPREIAVIAG